LAPSSAVLAFIGASFRKLEDCIHPPGPARWTAAPRAFPVMARLRARACSDQRRWAAKRPQFRWCTSRTPAQRRRVQMTKCGRFYATAQARFGSYANVIIGTTAT